MVKRMATHNKTITIRPAKGDLHPKKAKDQRTFNISCNINADIAILDCLVFCPLRQNINSETPISKYNIIHTGAKTESGGLKNGLFMFIYHVSTDCLVNKDPTMPATWHRTMLIISFAPFFILYYLDRVPNKG